jgi:hypothetical protein
VRTFPLSHRNIDINLCVHDYLIHDIVLRIFVQFEGQPKGEAENEDEAAYQMRLTGFGSPYRSLH